jgi:VanZ family protein
MFGRRMRTVLLLVYMGVIVILSSIPDTGETGDLGATLTPQVQNLLHIPAYGLLALLWLLTLKTYGVAWRRSLALAFVLATAYGVVMELSQGWIPGRVPSVLDALFNVLGILLCIGLYWWIERPALPTRERQASTAYPGRR